MRTLAWLLVLGIVACGTSSSTKNDGGCINATEGDSCSANDVACSLGPDPCCSGFMACQNDHWVKENLGCACQVSTFMCGGQTCPSGHYCEGQEVGVPTDGGPSTTYSCPSLPAACESDQTCACVEQAGACSPTAVASCDTSQGHVNIVCMGQ